MQYKTQGVVLFTSRYSDTFSIAHVFTRDFGRMAYLLPKSSGKKSKIKASLFFPLSVLNMEVEHLPLREIQRLKEVEREFPLYEICTDEVKISISFFLSEFLSKMLRETHESKPLFDYLKQSVHILEKAHRGLGNFHLAFMFGLTRFLGIFPNLDNYRSGAYFDLLNGIFVQQIPSHPHYLNQAQSTYLRVFCRIDYSNMHLFRMSRAERNVLIDYLLAYYRLHMYNFPPLKSLEVLRELF